MSDESTARARLDRVVVGIDGSEQSERALNRAVAEAQVRGSELEILCAAGWPKRSAVPVTAKDHEQLLKAANDLVERAAERVRERAPELRVVPHAPKATPADAIVEATGYAALTVVGTRGRGGFAGLLVGSVSLRAAAHCQGPLMVVGSEHPADSERRGTTLVGVNSEDDRDPVRFGFEDAKRNGAVLRVLHTWQRPPMPPAIPVPPTEITAAGEAAQELLRKAVAPLRGQYPDVEVKGTEHSGSVAGSLIEASRSADIVVLGTHRHRHRQRRLGLRLSAVGHAVLHHAHCPVVFVPSA